MSAKAVKQFSAGPDVREETVNFYHKPSDHPDETLIPRGTIASVTNAYTAHSIPGIDSHSPIQKLNYKDTGLDQFVYGQVKLAIDSVKLSRNADSIQPVSFGGMARLLNRGSVGLSVGDRLLAGPAVMITDNASRKVSLANPVEGENPHAHRYAPYPCSKTLFASEPVIVRQNAIFAADRFDREMKQLNWTIMPYLGAMGAVHDANIPMNQKQAQINQLIVRLSNYLTERGIPNNRAPADAAAGRPYHVLTVNLNSPEYKALVESNQTLAQEITIYMEQENLAADPKFDGFWEMYIEFMINRIFATCLHNIPVGNTGYCYFR